MARSYDEMMQGYGAFVQQQQETESRLETPFADDQDDFWSSIGDVAAAPFRGVEGAIQGIWNLADMITFDALPDYDNRLLGRSNTMLGGIVEGISQFAIPFFGAGLGVASKLGQISKVSGFLTKAETAAGATRKGAAIAKGRELGKYAVAGAVTDFAVFDAHEARLSDLIQMAPSLQNPISEYLASDEEDSELEGRLKNAIEGLGIGGLADVFLQSIRAYRAGARAKAAGKSGDEVMEAVKDGMVDAERHSARIATTEYTSSVAKALNIGDDRASGVVALIDSLGMDRASIKFEKFDPLVDTGTARLGDELVDTRATQGLVQFKEDGTAIITGFRSANVSTGIHEVAHVARRRLLNKETPEHFRRGIDEKELKAVEKWAGVKDGRWSVEAEEKFARGFEKYIRDGKAPTKGLQALFTKLGAWMRDIYEDVSGSQIDIDISPEIRQVMDRMVSRKGLPARQSGTGVRTLAQGLDPESGPRINAGESRLLGETAQDGEMIRDGKDLPGFERPLKDLRSRRKKQGYTEIEPGLFSRKNLAAHGLRSNSVFHETGLSSTRSILKILEFKTGHRFPAPLYVSDNLDLALGQKGKGYVIEMDARLLNGRLETGKPGLEIVSESGGGKELLADKYLKGALKAVIVPSRKAVESLRNTSPKQSGGAGFVPTRYLDFDNVTEVERGFRIPRKPHKRFQSESEPTVLRQEADPHSIEAAQRELNEINPDAVPTPRQGGVVNTRYASTDEGARQVFARAANQQQESLAAAGRESLAENAEEGVKRAGKLLDDVAELTGDPTVRTALKDKLDTLVTNLQDQLHNLTAVRTVLSGLGADLYQLASKGVAASEEDCARFLQMESVYNLYQHTAVNMARAVARKLVNQKFAPPVDIKRGVMPDLLVTGGRGADEAAPGAGRGTGEGEGLGPGRGPGEGEGLGPGRGPGEGGGTGTGRGEGEPTQTDWANARRQVIEDIGEGDFERGITRVRARMKRFSASYDPKRPGRSIDLLRKKDNALVFYWMNSILSGPSTHIVNMASAVATSLFMPFEKALGSAISASIGMGKWSNVVDELSTYKYLFESASDAFRVAGKSLKENQNFLDPNVRAVEYRPTGGISDVRPDTDDLATASKKWVTNVVGAPSRFLAAEDEFFKQLNYRAMLKRDLWKTANTDPATRGLNHRQRAAWVDEKFERAVKDDQMYSEQKIAIEAAQAAQARGLMPGGDDYDQFIAAYAQRNWDPNVGRLAQQARDAARQSTFTTPLSKDRGVLVSVSSGVNDIINNHPMLRFAVPFVRTPTNLLKFYLDRSPLALKDLMKKDVFNALKGDEAMRQDFFGRTATGAMGFFGLYNLAASGYITGGGPRNKHERELKMKTGWQPYSIKTEDGWVSYRRLDPFATFLGLAADVNETLQAAVAANDQQAADDIMNIVPAITIAAGKNVASKSYLTGLTRIFGAVSDPERGGPSLLRQLGGSFVPSVVHQSQTAFGDEDLRSINSVLEAIQARIPGLSEDLDPRRNFLGDVQQHPGQGEFFNPFTYTETSNTRIYSELEKVGHGFLPPRSTKNGVDLHQFKNNKGQSAYDRWLELQGETRIYGRTLEQELTRLFNSAQYKRLPEEAIEGLDRSPRVSAINRVLSKYRAKAFEQMLREFPEVNRKSEIGQLIRQNRRMGRDVSQLLSLLEDQ